MRQPFGLQEWIHKLEEGEAAKYIRYLFIALLFFALTALWHIRQAKNFTSVEAMDAGQVARRLSEGKGFTTDFIRPFSIALLERAHGEGQMQLVDHPDLANAPLYPAALALAMKVLPFKWSIPAEKSFWRYQPEILIGFFNQLLFLILLIQVFFIARKLFDAGVAWTSSAVLALTVQMWEFTTSGLSTMLVAVLFMAMVSVLLKIESRSRAEIKSPVIMSSAGLGVLLGALFLARYSMGWLILPSLLFLILFTGPNRVASTSIVLLLFVLTISPWIYRNYSQSESFLGTAGYAIHHKISAFPDNRMDRLMPHSIQAELNKATLNQYVRKFVENISSIFGKGIPENGGTWIWGFFLVGVFIPFINPSLSRLRYFLIGVLLLFSIVQSLGVTELSDLSPIYNTENLIIIAYPLVVIFGTALFFVLLDQLQIAAPVLRRFIITAYITVMALPLIILLLPPREYPISYPPYYPPNIQQVAHWLDEKELMMTDMPWATAWYGQRQSVWITLDAGTKRQDDFYRINDYGKAFRGLYLTPITTDSKFLTQMRQSPEQVWGRFYLDVVVLKNLPTGFPLKTAPTSILPDQLFLSDRVRWSRD